MDLMDIRLVYFQIKSHTLDEGGILCLLSQSPLVVKKVYGMEFQIVEIELQQNFSKV